MSNLALSERYAVAKWKARLTPYGCVLKEGYEKKVPTLAYETKKYGRVDRRTDTHAYKRTDTHAYKCADIHACKRTDIHACKRNAGVHCIRTRGER
ncbi:hypothetical protein POVWA2_029590 [Plasmodium ovale wallikeri]|uniref:Uncharacterized protein n=1 Tax=Plasmodium ovale wallikeri TaxID=864142 RepID=A0A1A8YXZ0_PLAOA|nr:hypothetical protein POVWA1_029990 [Plasmodium ovale wallikeri]SBT36325.1 hypothetical protein POVWA2_029590 [Plasmodium ovale wallikeri]